MLSATCWQFLSASRLASFARMWLKGLERGLRLAGIDLLLAFCAVFCVLVPDKILAGETESPELAATAYPKLEQMLGAMLMLGFRGSSLEAGDAFLNAIASGQIGNVLLFDRDLPSGGGRNISSPAQLRALCAVLRENAPQPMLIAVDQEGGQVRRLKPEKGFAELPSAQRLGQGNFSETRKRAQELGRELRGLGINVDLAPVADVDSNPFNPAIGKLGRAFSSDPLLVSGHALAFGLGLAESGVIPTLKHFPGQGCASADSHQELPNIDRCWDPARDLLPYAEIFAQGWPGMVMPGHLYLPKLDPVYPASLSRAVIQGLLRNGLGWQGVVISDDLGMKAIAGKFGLKEAIFLAVQAGVDILLFGNNLDWDAALPQKAHAALLSLVYEGKISEERIKQSWRRIQKLHSHFAKAGF